MTKLYSENAGGRGKLGRSVSGIVPKQQLPQSARERRGGKQQAHTLPAIQSAR
eukprot:SAG22_NODE_1519_length_4238_cov_2.188935_3_plen_53_part_00